MPQKAHFLLLLHMHQPYYYNPELDEYQLPWVRLHSVREYYDVVNLALSMEEARLTINLVPSLLMQIRDNAEHPEKDYFFRLSAAEPKELLEKEVVFILKNFFMANWQRLIFPLPRFQELLEKRGRDVKQVEWQTALKKFTRQDIFDLQVLFNLAWIGFSAEEKFEEVKALKKKGRGYSDADKKTVLSLHKKILSTLIESYKKAAKTGRIELTTTPAYHPILPLLINNEIARRCDPSTPIPTPPFSFPEDAKMQVFNGKRIFKEVFGASPKGMWPSEGSVAPEIIPIVADNGFDWIATDEEVARTSLKGLARDDVVFKPWRAGHEGKEVTMVFRDKYLSDLIGFTYSRNAAAAAVAHFISRLEDICRVKANAQITVILDGENPWEHYENGGKDFLTLLFREVAKSGFIEMKTVSESIAERPPSGTIAPLHSASWINNNFRIWIGQEEENRAWDYLREVRRLVSAYPDKKSENYKKTMEAIYAAEGSDWFWWYGGKFASETPELFDALFRAHLKKACEYIGTKPPDFLDQPIVGTSREAEPVLEPSEPINPKIDGVITSYYEWWGAAKVSLIGTRSGGGGDAMAQTSHIFESLFFGFNTNSLFLRLDLHKKECAFLEELFRGDLQLEFTLSNSTIEERVILFVSKEGSPLLSRVEIGAETGSGDSRKFAGSVAIEDVIEIKLSQSQFALPKGKNIELSIRLLKTQGGHAPMMELARYPRNGHYKLVIPTIETQNEHWSAL